MSCKNDWQKGQELVLLWDDGEIHFAYYRYEGIVGHDYRLFTSLDHNKTFAIRDEDIGPGDFFPSGKEAVEYNLKEMKEESTCLADRVDVLIDKIYRYEDELNDTWDLERSQP